MKTVRKKIKVIDASVELHCSSVAPGHSMYEYKFSSDELIHADSVEVTHEVEIPETLKEFREQKGLSKLELVEWLNQYYK